MSKRLTRDEFIRRAKALHGDKYRYDQVEYVNTKTKVLIECPAHGIFEQSPEKHLAGQGCPHPDCVNDRIDRTNMARYGVHRPLQSDGFKAQARATSMERYGFDNPMKSDEVQAKARATNLVKFGVEHSGQAAAVRSKIDATMLSRYGGRSPFSSEAIRAKARSSLAARYGVANPMQSPGIRSKLEHTNMARYGVAYPLQSDAIRSRARETMRIRYGGTATMGCEALAEAVRRTVKVRYGVGNVMQDPAVAARVSDSKAKNGTFNSSDLEDALYGLLSDRFGPQGVLRQYRDEERYPFSCDFYVPSRDLFIELNAFWLHGGHWYDAELDADLLAEYMEKARTSQFYANAIDVWTRSDVEKRRTAAEHGLNYLVLWDNGLRDARLWLAAGCPDARDWDRPYSWLEE